MKQKTFDFSNKHVLFTQINNLLKEIANRGVDYNNSRTVNDKRVADIAKYIKTEIPDLLKGIINDDSYYIKGSVGAGILTKTPWIAIMDKRITNTTQNGIYIVFLFSRDLKKVSFGIAGGTTVKGKFGFRLKPKQVLERTKSIRAELSIDNPLFGMTSPDVEDKGYKASSIYNIVWDYNIDSDKPGLLSAYLQLYNDRFEVFKNYSGVNPTEQPQNGEEIKKMAASISTQKETTSLSDELASFKQYLLQSSLVFNDTFIDRFVLSLRSKPFVILSGLTGSGKTQLAMAFAKWKKSIGTGDYLIVPVGADWTNREYLLGYPNALQPGEYVKPNGALDLLIKANNDTSKDYFLILDEMNMSYVERYFADFLSAMESGEYIPLWTNKPDDTENEVPKEISLPKNFYVIGTINVDETTYMFSPKVLDRAFVLEFHIEKNDMEKFLEMTAPDFKDTLLAIFEQLGRINAEFGYRTAKEISEYMKNATLCGIDSEDILDAVIMQKLLPKVHGSRKKITPTLMELWKICFDNKDANIDALKEYPEDKVPRYPISAKKIWRMYQILQDNGFVSFSEA